MDDLISKTKDVLAHLEEGLGKALAIEKEASDAEAAAAAAEAAANADHDAATHAVAEAKEA